MELHTFFLSHYYFFYQPSQNQHCLVANVSIELAFSFEVDTHFTMPYPRLTMMTRVRASERFTAESSSARTKASWTMWKKGRNGAELQFQPPHHRRSSLNTSEWARVSDLLKRDHVLYNFYKHTANITNELSCVHNNLGVLTHQLTLTSLKP